MSRGRRVDSTARAIFDAARKAGAVTVEIPTAKLRTQGCPDGFIWHPRCGWQAVEAKGPKTRTSRAQLELAKRAPVHLIRTPEGILAVIFR